MTQEPVNSQSEKLDQEPQPIKSTDRRILLIKGLLRSIDFQLDVGRNQSKFIEHLCREDNFQIAMQFKTVVDRFNING